MFLRLSVRMHRFVHGEDVLDAWPAGAEPEHRPSEARHLVWHRRPVPHS